MPVEIQGFQYLSLGEVAEEIGVTRQTLWRWRRDDAIPQGHRGRKGMVLFNPEEVRAIRAFVERVEPIPPPGDPEQVSLFESGKEK